jgi:hypothetical protein
MVRCVLMLLFLRGGSALLFNFAFALFCLLFVVLFCFLFCVISFFALPLSFASFFSIFFFFFLDQWLLSVSSSLQPATSGILPGKCFILFIFIYY